MHNEDKGSLTEKFREFGAAPSDGLWESISAGLDERKKRRFAVWWWTSGLAALLAVVVALWFAWSDEAPAKAADKSAANTKNTPVVSPKETKTTDRAGNSASGHATIDRESTAAGGFREKEHTANTPRNHSSVGDEQHSPGKKERESRETLFPKETPSIVNETALPERIIANNDSVPVEKELSVSDSVPDNREMLADSGDSISAIDESMVLVRVFTPRWIFGAHFGGMHGNGFAETGVQIFSTAALDNYLAQNTPPSAIPFHQYWSGELSVSRKIRRRFWLESGLQTGVFRSGEVHSQGDYYTAGSVTTWTVGIPLSLRCNLFSYRKFSLFAGIGTLHNFPFGRELRYVETGMTTETVKRSSTYGYVGSAHVNLGIDYRLRHNWYIELRPEFRWYYSPLQSVYEGVPSLRSPWWGGTIGVVKQFERLRRPSR